MNPIAALLTFLTLTFHLLLPTAADFHIAQTIFPKTKDRMLIACPSNQLNCDCFVNGKNSGWVVAIDEKHRKPDGPAYWMDASRKFCGQKKSLSFYLRNQNTTLDFFLDGNPTVQGTCYQQVGQQEPFCKNNNFFSAQPGNQAATDLWVCISNICNP